MYDFEILITVLQYYLGSSLHNSIQTYFPLNFLCIALLATCVKYTFFIHFIQYVLIKYTILLI